MDIELKPEKAGFAPDRLDRVDRHFARYVDDGLLAGWQLAIARDGKLVHHATYGLRDREAGLPVEPDTIWRVYSMTSSGQRSTPAPCRPSRSGSGTCSPTPPA